MALAACAAGYFVTGLSSGYFLAAYLLLPALLTSLLLWLVREDRRWLLGGHTALIHRMAAALVAGKLFAEHVFAFVSKDSEMELIPIGQLARNLLAALDGWFALLVALPLTEDVTVFSRDGILYLFGAAIALALLGAPRHRPAAGLYGLSDPGRTAARPARRSRQLPSASFC